MVKITRPYFSFFGNFRVGTVWAGVTGIVSLMVATATVIRLKPGLLGRPVIIEVCPRLPIPTGELNVNGSYNNPGDDMDDTVTTHSVEDDTISGYLVMAIVHVLLGIFNIVPCIVLIVGAVTKNDKLVYPWIIITGSTYSFGFLMMLAFGIFALVTGNLSEGLGLILFVFCSSIFQSYWFLVVLTFHKSLIARLSDMELEPMPDVEPEPEEETLA